MKYLEFYTSIQEEKNILISMFQNDKTLDLKYRIRQYKFPSKLARRINKMSQKTWNVDLDNLLYKIYLKDSKKLKKALAFFNTYWENHESYFFNKLKTIFNKEISKYNVLLSRYVAGTSDWEGTNICTNAYSYKYRHKNDHIYFLLFEIILSEIFKTIRQNRTKEELSDNNVWIVSELSSFIILHEEYNIFNNIIKTYYYDIDKLIPEAKEIYREFPKIDIFIEKFINLLKIDN